MSRGTRAERETTATVMRAIGDELLRWTCERHATDRPLDRRLLRDRALELAGEYGLTGVWCSERWLTCFLKRHGFSLNPDNSAGPIFTNYRHWIDMIRSIISRYKHKDLFHLDELTMYADLTPDEIASTMRDATQPGVRSDAILKRATVLMCCNASGTEKLPLLICGPYPTAMTYEDHAYSHSEDAAINDGLFRAWLSRLNDRMLRNDRRILLLLSRERLAVSRNLQLSNVERVFFPVDFPPLLRPLKRDVFHFVKMIYRSKYVDDVRERL